MKYTKGYQETMQKLYDAAMKYPDEKLAKAVGEVRDLLVEYKNIIDSYNVHESNVFSEGRIYEKNRN